MTWAWTRIKEWFTAARAAYIVGLAVSGATGHTVAIASVSPRLQLVEERLALVEVEARSDRAKLDRIEGMIYVIGVTLGIDGRALGGTP